MPAALLFGCAGVTYAIDNYSGVKVISYTSPAQSTSYRIFDKPGENRLMITSSLANAMGQGALKGLTLMNTTPPEILFEQAAIEFLASTGRTCIAKRTFLVVDPQFEVQYECVPALAEAPPKTAIASANGHPNTVKPVDAAVSVE